MKKRVEESEIGLSQSIEESPMKLPLAPILSTPHDTRASSTRRGSSIFSPTGTLDPPPPPQQDPAPDPDPPPPPPPSHHPIKYKECLKNHAASIGGHVLDGCGEFMPNGDEGTPEAMRCAACDCHRSFHRRHLPPIHRPPLLQGSGGMVSFGGNSGGAESSSDGGGAPSKKRFRTKFREDQKERMHEFASKLGWRIQKQDVEEVNHFCSEVGVKKQVFKVWMHNNKQAIKKRSLTS